MRVRGRADETDSSSLVRSLDALNQRRRNSDSVNSRALAIAPPAVTARAVANFSSSLVNGRPDPTRYNVPQSSSATRMAMLSTSSCLPCVDHSEPPAAHSVRNRASCCSAGASGTSAARARWPSTEPTSVQDGDPGQGANADECRQHTATGRTRCLESEAHFSRNAFRREQ